MPVATPAAVRTQIAAGNPDPIYLLIGEDDVEKAALAAEFADLVDEGLRAFNTERLHAGEWTTGDRLLNGVADIVTAARTLPMMSPRRVVTVTQVETLLAPKRESDAADKALELFKALLANPDPQTTIVLVGAGVDKRSRLYKHELVKHATIVECGAIETLADAERWVRNRVAAQGVEIEPAAARLLAERAGTDLKRLRADVDRLLLYALGQTRVTLADARELIGPAALQDDWAMTNAIEAGNTGEALRQLALMFDAGAPQEMILGQLAWVVRAKFAAIAPQQLPSAVEALFQADLALKSSGGDARVLLDRLIVELCAGKRARGGPARRW
jgi:DNA polymerase III subunit delta